MSASSHQQQEPLLTDDERQRMYLEALLRERAGYEKQLAQIELEEEFDEDAAREARRLRRVIDEVTAERQRAIVAGAGRQAAPEESSL